MMMKHMFEDCIILCMYDSMDRLYGFKNKSNVCRCAKFKEELPEG